MGDLFNAPSEKQLESVLRIDRRLMRGYGTILHSRNVNNGGQNRAGIYIKNRPVIIVSTPDMNGTYQIKNKEGCDIDNVTEYTESGYYQVCNVTSSAYGSMIPFILKNSVSYIDYNSLTLVPYQDIVKFDMYGNVDQIVMKFLQYFLTKSFIPGYEDIDMERAYASYKNKLDIIIKSNMDLKQYSINKTLTPNKITGMIRGKYPINEETVDVDAPIYSDLIKSINTPFKNIADLLNTGDKKEITEKITEKTVSVVEKQPTVKPVEDTDYDIVKRCMMKRKSSKGNNKSVLSLKHPEDMNIKDVADCIEIIAKSGSYNKFATTYHIGVSTVKRFFDRGIDLMTDNNIDIPQYIKVFISDRADCGRARSNK